MLIRICKSGSPATPTPVSAIPQFHSADSLLQIELDRSVKSASLLVRIDSPLRRSGTTVAKSRDAASQIFRQHLEKGSTDRHDILGRREIDQNGKIGRGMLGRRLETGSGETATMDQHTVTRPLQLQSHHLRPRNSSHRQHHFLGTNLRRSNVSNSEYCYSSRRNHSVPTFPGSRRLLGV